MATLDGQPFLAVNGVQTLSQSTASMAHRVETLAEAGVASLRLSPQSQGFGRICAFYADRLAGRLTAPALEALLRPMVPGQRLSDGFPAGPSGAAWSGAMA